MTVHKSILGLFHLKSSGGDWKKSWTPPSHIFVSSPPLRISNGIALSFTVASLNLTGCFNFLKVIKIYQNCQCQEVLAMCSQNLASRLRWHQHGTVSNRYKLSEIKNKMDVCLRGATGKYNQAKCTRGGGLIFSGFSNMYSRYP